MGPARLTLAFAAKQSQNTSCYWIEQPLSLCRQDLNINSSKVSNVFYHVGVCGISKYGTESGLQKPGRTELFLEFWKSEFWKSQLIESCQKGWWKSTMLAAGSTYITQCFVIRMNCFAELVDFRTKPILKWFRKIYDIPFRILKGNSADPYYHALPLKYAIYGLYVWPD